VRHRNVVLGLSIQLSTDNLGVSDGCHSGQRRVDPSPASFALPAASAGAAEPVLRKSPEPLWHNAVRRFGPCPNPTRCRRAYGRTSNPERSPPLSSCTCAPRFHLASAALRAACFVMVPGLACLRPLGDSVSCGSAPCPALHPAICIRHCVLIAAFHPVSVPLLVSPSPSFLLHSAWLPPSFGS
jgi:hypothetical protein